ncbi:hypothetical protein M5K25_026445 [Dendrobium thyrsiflorum]|uniref:Uncharacterized protein n=1 Tax=Dendrobium thyrsiflorum TaxID=117978 RepID=A0ABD0TXK9_DENTH
MKGERVKLEREKILGGGVWRGFHTVAPVLEQLLPLHLLLQQVDFHGTRNEKGICKENRLFNGSFRIGQAIFLFKNKTDKDYGVWPLIFVQIPKFFFAAIFAKSTADFKMASRDQRQKELIKNTFRRGKKVTGGPSRPTHTEGAALSQPASQSQPRPPVPPPTSTPFNPYYPPPPSHGGPPPYPYPYPPYVPPPPQPSTGEPSTPAAAQQATEGRMLIEPDGDMFHPSKHPTHKIRDIIRSRYDAPYLSWKKVPKDVRDMWFREFEFSYHINKKNFERRGSIRMRDMFTDLRKADERPLWIGEGVWPELTSVWVRPDYSKRRDQNRQNIASDVGGLSSSLHTGGSVLHTEHRRRLEEYTRLRESQAVAGEGPSGGSAEISDYHTWSQAVGGVQHGRVYGLGSQAYTYEWQTSGSSSFSPSTQESLYTQQIAALTAELEQVRKSQADWLMQMQQQQAEMQRQQDEMQEEMQKMREHISSGRSTTADEETDSE